jgi:rhodanese-related sulfurtransferase
MRPFLAALIPLFFMSFSALSQATEAEFQAMLQQLYQHSVPVMEAEAVDSLAGYQLLDARAEEEFAVSHLPGARRVGYQDFSLEKVTSLDKNQPVLVYCTVGYRSERIGDRLRELGFNQVYNLYGGIFGWVHAGKTVTGPDGQPTERVHTYNEDWSQWLRQGAKVWGE